jgi:hypothetical protein
VSNLDELPKYCGFNNTQKMGKFKKCHILPSSETFKILLHTPVFLQTSVYARTPHFVTSNFLKARIPKWQ